MKYRKKPVVIEAHQLGSDGYWPKWLEARVGLDVLLHPEVDGCKIKTLEGEMIANKGDWIIKGLKGELYPCKPDIFAASYELAEPVVSL
jgi:hypothetical protein